MKVTPEQQAAFDAATAAIRERQAARQAQAQRGGNAMGGGPPPGMRVVMGGAGGANIQAQVRQRMAERFKEDFAAFRATLDEAQGKQWDSALANLLNAKRVTIYRLEDGKAQPVMVRIGASDGTNTEVSGGGLKEGDLIITGERAKE